MTEEAKRCVKALQNSIRKGNEWVGNPDFSMPCKGLIRLIESLSEQLEHVTRERDAAVRDIDEAAPCFACICFERNGGDCIGAHVCIDDILQDAPGGKHADYYWQWRGVEVE